MKKVLVSKDGKSDQERIKTSKGYVNGQVTAVDIGGSILLGLILCSSGQNWPQMLPLKSRHLGHQLPCYQHEGRGQ